MIHASDAIVVVVIAMIVFITIPIVASNVIAWCLATGTPTVAAATDTFKETMSTATTAAQPKSHHTTISS